MSDYTKLARLSAPRDVSSGRPTARKPHRDFIGYVCELRNEFSSGHNVILDCKQAEEDGHKLVENYEEEGGRYQILCNTHGQYAHCKDMPTARKYMKDATYFCLRCREISGEIGV